ncbi:MAG TPA: hypothetical protein PLB12_06080 [Candidatus Goldiibacteriota bacterium]|nr:hypothetical protein [Candidatus Goldiibacteriota bacterium]HPI04431.1 hypothetical protein [Candidatus Goldiibacteriota bacterium]HRQ43905.1 hypothetical protein [Candidatus Goldiibacteriota bacterium]
MNRRLAAEISLLIGSAGFFAGGLISINKEISDILMSAVLIGVTAFFMSYFGIALIYNEEMEKKEKKVKIPEIKKTAGPVKEDNKGKRIDLKAGDNNIEDLFR